jgi:ERCC4-related helicase
MQTLDCFVRGKFNVLVATSVAEEGLDLPACQLVVSDLSRARNPFPL